MEDVLRIGVTDNGSACVLRLSGELDSYTCSYLSRVGEQWIRTVQEVALDLGAIKYIDSEGLSVLVRMWVRAMQNNTRLTIARSNPRLERIFEITGLGNLFTVDTLAPEAQSLLAPRYRRAVVDTGQEQPVLAQAGTAAACSQR